ncbi:extracellular solute-binding protein [Candidatus Enterococcus leclercqii]|uniref:extracellular solute-binding protein n=1 Tax=Enterococcus TaxID=1350 RepID=UPI001379D34D|nr:extracellular solute-binding protein [Enterococcus sp. CU9D]KAF1292683.1 sugar ABC transporter substrate-binding protein [Enterococcus sp. CU9D]
MKKNWKKILMSSAVLGISALTLAACGSSKDDASGGDTNTSGSGDAAKIEGDLKLWVDTDHIKAIQGIVDNFVKENPDVKVEVKAGSSADAKADVSKDPEKAADVFMMPHDQVGQMAEAGLLYPVGTKQAETIKENNTEASVNGVTWNDKIYGYPYGVESQVLYYNKSKLSADDVKTWETLTAKGKIGTNFGEAGANYIFGPLFMSNGDVLFGENGEDLQGTNFNNDNGIQVLKWIAAQKSNPGVVQSSESALSNLQSGKTDAFLSGPWSKNDVEKALGDNMAVAAYPTIDFGDGAKQMMAFMGVKLYGVNQQTKSPLAAMALAEYLTNKDSQMIEFETNGVIPSNKEAQADSKVTDDAVAKAVMEMTDPEHTVVMPKLPEMVSFWPPMDALINDTYKGNIKEADYQAKLDKFVQDISKKVEE